jgi:hypothetical protein
VHSSSDGRTETREASSPPPLAPAELGRLVAWSWFRRVIIARTGNLPSLRAADQVRSIVSTRCIQHSPYSPYIHKHKSSISCGDKTSRAVSRSSNRGTVGVRHQWASLHTDQSRAGNAHSHRRTAPSKDQRSPRAVPGNRTGDVGVSTNARVICHRRDLLRGTQTRHAPVVCPSALSYRS